MKRITLLIAALASSLHAEVKLSKVFTPHMVLQQGMEVPIWGTASPNEKVSVSFRGQTKTAEASADGKWRVKLDALKAGGPDVLTVGDKKIDDVLVGEVWIGSGQSNMDMLVTSYTAGDPALAKIAMGSYPNLRLMRKDAGAVWEQATPETIAKFSALLFSFGQPLQAKLNVPVGLMVGAVGGTPSGFWLTEDMIKADAACQAQVKQMAPTYDFAGLTAKYHEEKAKYDQEFAVWKPLADAAQKAGTKAPPGPRSPQPVGKPGEVNSGKMGQLFESYIRPYVGYAIKGVLWDQGESRTNVACVEQYNLMGALIKGWRAAWGQGEFPFLYVQKPSGWGCAWDYTNPMNLVATPFYKSEPPVIPAAPELQYCHAYWATFMKHPGTYMVTSSDLGAGTHPTNKSAYGLRAVQVAQSVVYGGKEEYLGPLYASHEIKGGKVTIKFTHTGKGLAFRNGDRMQGFIIAGADKKFVWADAAIEGDTVVVSSKTVTSPAAVRYGWSQIFNWANLFNKDGLPATPFRTDAW